MKKHLFCTVRFVLIQLAIPCHLKRHVLTRIPYLQNKKLEGCKEVLFSKRTKSNEANLILVDRLFLSAP